MQEIKHGLNDQTFTECQIIGNDFGKPYQMKKEKKKKRKWEFPRQVKH